MGFPSEDGQAGNSPTTPTLPGEQTDLDFRLIQPTAMFGRVVDRQAFPESVAPFLSEIVGEGLPAMNVEIVHHDVNRSRRRVTAYYGVHGSGKFRSGAIRRGQGEMPSGLRLHGTEDVRRAAPFVLVVPLGDSARSGRRRRP